MATENIIPAAYNLSFGGKNISLSDEDMNEFIDQYSANLDTSRMSKAQRNAVNQGLADLRSNLRGATYSGTLGDKGADVMNITGGNNAYFDPNIKFDNKADRYAQEHARNAMSGLAKWAYDRQLGIDKKAEIEKASKDKLEADKLKAEEVNSKASSDAEKAARIAAYNKSKAFKNYVLGDNTEDYYNRAIEDNALYGTQEARDNAALAYFDNILDKEKEGSEFAGQTKGYQKLAELRSKYDTAEDKQAILRQMADASGSYIEIDDFLKGTRLMKPTKEGESISAEESKPIEVKEWQPGIYTSNGRYAFDKEGKQAVEDGEVIIDGNRYYFENGQPVQFREEKVSKWSDLVAGKQPEFIVGGLPVSFNDKAEVINRINEFDPNYLKYSKNQQALESSFASNQENERAFELMNIIAQEAISDKTKSKKFQDSSKSSSLPVVKLLDKLGRDKYKDIERWAEITDDLNLTGTSKAYALTDKSGNTKVIYTDGQQVREVPKERMADLLSKIRGTVKKNKQGGEILTPEQEFERSFIEFYNSSIAKMQKGGKLLTPEEMQKNMQAITPNDEDVRKGFNINDLKNIGDFSDSDMLEVGGTLLEIAGLAGGFIPGAGAALGLGAGATGDIMNAIAKSKRGEDWGMDLAKNLGLTAVSIIPGLGAAKAPKLAKAAAKAGKWLGAAAVAMNAPQLATIAEKVSSGKFGDLDTNDLKALMGLLSGAKSLGVARGIKQGSKTVKSDVEIGTNKQGNPVKIPGSQAEELNSIKDKVERLKKLKELVGADGKVNSDIVGSARVKGEGFAGNILRKKVDVAKKLKVGEEEVYTGELQRTGRFPKLDQKMVNWANRRLGVKPGTVETKPEAPRVESRAQEFAPIEDVARRASTDVIASVNARAGRLPLRSTNPLPKSNQTMQVVPKQEVGSVPTQKEAAIYRINDKAPNSKKAQEAKTIADDYFSKNKNATYSDFIKHLRTIKGFSKFKNGGVFKAATGISASKLKLGEDQYSLKNLKKLSPTLNTQGETRETASLPIATASGTITTKTPESKYSLYNLGQDVAGGIKGLADSLDSSTASQIYNSIMANRDTERLKKYANKKYATISASEKSLPTIGYDAQAEAALKNRAAELNRGEIRTSNLAALLAMKNAQNAQASDILSQSEAMKSDQLARAKAAEREVLDYNTAARNEADYRNRATAAEAENIKQQTLGTLEQQQLQNTQRLREYLAQQQLQKEQKLEHLGRIKNEYDLLINDTTLQDLSNEMNEIYAAMTPEERANPYSNPKYAAKAQEYKRAEANQSLKREAARAGINAKEYKI